jgi:hypothetical protein
VRIRARHVRTRTGSGAFSRERRGDLGGELVHERELVVDELAHDEVGRAGRRDLTDAFDATFRRTDLEPMSAQVATGSWPATT